MTPSTSSEDPVGAAQRLADEVLFPAALETDAAETLPRERLDVLAEAGFYGLLGPAWAGGMEADLDTVCAVTEALASGCLTTAFVWAQHVKTAFVAAVSPTPAIREWAEPLCRGETRSGLALAGALPGPTRVRAHPVDGGWQLTGPCPWVSGWGRVDVLHTAAVDGGGATVWGLVDAREGPALVAERVALAALNATATVNVDFDGCFLPDERVTLRVPPGGPPGPDAATLRIHAAFALGVASRCTMLVGKSPLDDELAACRHALTTAGDDEVADARAAASELAWRASATLASVTGSRSLRTDEHAQRLAREALFTAVFAARSPIREAFLARLGAGSES